MIIQEFEAQMARIHRDFKNHNLTAGKTEMIWAVARDYSAASFEKVVTHMIASFRRAPTVQDFIEGLRGERRLFSVDHKTQAINCRACLDSGLISVETDEIEGIVICHCEAGTTQPWKLPRAVDVHGIKKCTPLPWEAFKPDIRTGDSDEVLDRKINEKMRWWKQTIRNEECAWQAHFEKLNAK